MKWIRKKKVKAERTSEAPCDEKKNGKQGRGKEEAVEEEEKKEQNTKKGENE